MTRTSALACITLLAIACTSPTTREAPDDVIYESEATDEAWLTIDDANDVVDDARAPHLLTPTGAISRTGAAPTFTWDGGAVAGSMVLAPRTRGLGERVWDELFPVAHAHEPPVTGAMYRVVFDLGTMPPLRVLTGATTYTPDAAAWARVLASTTPPTLEITGTYLSTGRIEQGPFVRATPATLTIE